MLSSFPHPAAPSAFYSPAPTFAHTTATLFGDESAQVERLINGLLMEWAKAEERASEPDVNDLEYRAMTPTRVLNFKARVKMRGQGRPLPYQIDDSDE
jgi:hypothetical protein